MKKLIIAALAAIGLGGCVAVPAPYYGEGPGYYAAPAVGVGIYAGPGYYSHRHGRGGHHRRYPYR